VVRVHVKEGVTLSGRMSSKGKRGANEKTNVIAMERDVVIGNGR